MTAMLNRAWNSIKESTAKSQKLANEEFEKIASDDSMNLAQLKGAAWTTSSEGARRDEGEEKDVSDDHTNAHARENARKEFYGNAVIRDAPASQDHIEVAQVKILLGFSLPLLFHSNPTPTTTN